MQKLFPFPAEVDVLVLLTVGRVIWHLYNQIEMEKFHSTVLTSKTNLVIPEPLLKSSKR